VESGLKLKLFAVPAVFAVVNCFFLESYAKTDWHVTSDHAIPPLWNARR